MQRPGFKKSITEFAAGGLFAFAVLYGVGLTLFLKGTGGLFRLVSEASGGSMALSFPQLTESSQTDTADSAEGGYPDYSRLFELMEGGGGYRPYQSLGDSPAEAEDPEDPNEEPEEPLPYPDALNSDGGRIIRRTYSYTPSSSCIELPGGGMLRNSSSSDMEYIKEQLEREPELEISLDGSPQVIIMHTHTTECYEPYQRESYDSEFSSRTTELDKSVVAVGREIADALEAAGIGVIHDTAVHDYPRYSGAYDRSSERVISLLEEYPTVKIVLDIHRDAIEDSGVRYAPVCEVDGRSAAQVMIICGCTNVPRYRYNLRLASKIQSKLEKDYPGLTRPILVADRNYNQELTKGSLLIEVGSSANSLDEALYAGRLVGMSLGELLSEYS